MKIRKVVLTFAFAIMACGNVYDRKIPADLKKDSSSFFNAVKTLPDDDRELLAGFLIRSKMAEAFSGINLVDDDMTVGQAIDRQRKFVADQKAKEAALAKKEAENKRIAQILAHIQDLTVESGSMAGRSEFRQAKAKIEEALAVAPGSNIPEVRLVNERNQMILADIDDVIKRNIAGKWVIHESTNQMTDDKTINIALGSDTRLQGYVDEVVQPSLVIRCRERGVALFIRIGIGVRTDYGDYDQVTGRLRFDQSDAEKVRFDISTDHQTVFFPDPLSKWIHRLSVQAGSKLHVEIPNHQSGRQIITFDLTGADVAMKTILQTCGKK